MIYILLILMLGISSGHVWADGSLYPMVDKEDWDDLWEVDAEAAWGHNPARSQIDLNYHRFVVAPRDANVAGNLVTALGWTSSSRVIVVKCGFGWVLEGLNALGITQILCTETSPYIQANKALNEDVDLRAKVEDVGLVTNSGDGLTVFNAFRDGGGARSPLAALILNQDLATRESRQVVRTAIGGPGFDIMTYDGYLNTHTDGEAEALSANLHAMPGVGRVIHHVYLNWLNTHTLDEWKVLLPNDTFILHGTWEVRE